MLSKIDFGTLVAWVQRKVEGELDRCDVSHLESLVTPSVNHTSPIMPGPAVVKDMLQAIVGGRKIDAIRAYRVLTGEGLKESKDAIEFTMGQRTYW